MRQFTDRNGRQWQVAVTHGAIKRVRGLAGVDLYKWGDGDPPLLVRLHEPELFGDVLYCLCLPQAESRGVTAQEFGEALGGEAIYAARQAFFDEYHDFFRQLRSPEAAAAIARVREFFDAVIKNGAEALAAILGGQDPLTSSSSSTTSPASSA